MAKVTIHVQGYGEVVVKRPKKLDKRSFSNALGEAVAGTCQIIVPPSNSKAFHPVLGVGGFDWDHENQRAFVRETPTPRVVLKSRGFAALRFRMRQVWGVVSGFGRGLRDAFY